MWFMPIIFILLLVGIFLWALMQFPAVDAAMKQLIRIVVIALSALWVLYIIFGHYGWLPK